MSSIPYHGRINMTRFHSSKHHRNAERTNAVAEIIGGGLKTVSPFAVIPCVFAQALTSTYCCFTTRLKIHERLIHAMRGLLAFTEIGILIVMLYENQTCSSLHPIICKTLLITELLYQGILLVSWVPSEFYKDNTEIITPPTSGSNTPPSTDVFHTPPSTPGPR